MLPPILIDSAVSIPPNEITAISEVPPPISTTMFPSGSSTLRPAPIAAAIGSSIKNTSLAPACCAASSIAFFSTSVTPYGTHIAILALTTPFLAADFCMK